MSVQNSEWLAWPPPLLRTAVRIASGSAFRSSIRSSTLLRLQVGVLLERGVQVVDVGLVVLAVVDLHRLRVDVGLERVERVRQAGKLVRHGIHDSLPAPGTARAGWRARDRPRRPSARPAKARSYTDAHVSTCRSGCDSRGFGPRRCPLAQQPATSLPRSRRARRCPASRRRARRPARPREALRRRAARPRTCATGCSGSPRARTTSARRTARRTPSSSPGCSARGATTTRIEEFQVLFPTPKRATLELVAPTPFVGLADRAGAAGGRDLRPDRRAAADLQRLLDRRRRDRASWSTSTTACPTTTRSWSARGIDVKGKIVIARYGGSLARHQAEGRGRARRGRLPHLLRSARRRLLPGRRLPEGRLAHRRTARSAARWWTCRSIPAIR